MQAGTVILVTGASGGIGAAFARLAALTGLDLNGNAITWLAPAALEGLARLETLDLHGNRLGAFDYGALVSMSTLQTLRLQNQENGGVGCTGTDRWDDDVAGVTAAVRSYCFPSEP